MANINYPSSGQGYSADKSVLQNSINSQDYITTQIQTNSKTALDQVSLRIKSLSKSTCCLYFTKTQNPGGGVIEFDASISDTYKSFKGKGVIQLVSTGPLYIHGILNFKNTLGASQNAKIFVQVNGQNYGRIFYKNMVINETDSTGFNVFYNGKKGDKINLASSAGLTFDSSDGIASNQLFVMWL